ncbi:MAG: DUF4348 domain-containing protein [Bacteroidetes bacterium]|nr:DUF4348 domain-containing protein [Bacteroidota bacterium]
MKKYFLFSSLIALIYSCSDSQNTNPKPTSLDSTSHSLVNTTEAFDSFFVHFKNDSSFQLSRIKFPLTEEYLDETKNDVIQKKKIINKKDWEYDNFYWDSSYVKRPVGGYRQKVLIGTDTARVQSIGVENGINIELLFALINNKWFLIKYSDNSN